MVLYFTQQSVSALPMNVENDMPIRATPEYGLVVRRSALHAKKVLYEEILDLLEVDSPLDANDQLISFGPSFGQEALDEFMSRLTQRGLDYYDDFFPLVFDVPHWMGIRVHLLERTE